MENQNIIQVEAKLQDMGKPLDNGVQIQVQFTNISKFPLRFPLQVQNFEDCFLIEVSENVEISDNQILQSEQERILPKISFPLGEEFYTIIAPGENFGSEYNLGKFFQTPGLYVFRLLFQARSGFRLIFEVEGSPKIVEQTVFPSNWVELEIK